MSIRSVYYSFPSMSNASGVAGETVRDIDNIVERQHADIYRDHPFLRPSDQVAWLRRLLARDDVRGALHLN